jgi:hypothetical protein
MNGVWVGRGDGERCRFCKRGVWLFEGRYGSEGGPFVTPHYHPHYTPRFHHLSSPHHWQHPPPTSRSTSGPHSKRGTQGLGYLFFSPCLPWSVIVRRQLDSWWRSWSWRWWVRISGRWRGIAGDIGNSTGEGEGGSEAGIVVEVEARILMGIVL